METGAFIEGDSGVIRPSGHARFGDRTPLAVDAPAPPQSVKRQTGVRPNLGCGGPIRPKSDLNAPNGTPIGDPGLADGGVIFTEGGSPARREFLMLLSVVAALALFAAPEAAQSGGSAADAKPAAEAKAEPKKTCYTSTPSGSRLPRRTCVIVAPKSEPKPETEAAAPAEGAPANPAS
jgi:hypothetical protein